VEERSFCPSCGRETRTVGDGACGDCWSAKPGGAPAIRDEPRTEPLGLFDLSWFEDHPYQAWALVAALVGAVLVVIGREFVW
jgi:hypothetical protein